MSDIYQRYESIYCSGTDRWTVYDKCDGLRVASCPTLECSEKIEFALNKVEEDGYDDRWGEL